MATKKKLLQAAAGSAGGGGLNVEDVFSTYLYTGNGTSQTITNGIDLSGEGGLMWFKRRDTVYSHHLYDTEVGVSSVRFSNLTNADTTGRSDVTVNSDGFSVGSTNVVNYNGSDFCSWTFRKAPKFFDVVTYTGDGTSNRSISHGLNSDVGTIIVKSTSNVTNWMVWHKDLTTNYLLTLNSTAAQADYSTVTIHDVTSTSFQVDNYSMLNASGVTYVAYLFAHNNGDGDFGPTGDQDIIKCGSYTGNGSTTGPEIDLGFEPQWLLIKNASLSGSNWFLMDNMRGLVNGSTAATTDGEDPTLFPNLSNAEVSSGFNTVSISATGFSLNTTSAQVNGSGNTMIYIAIRRGPMAVPESATDVFAIDTSGTASPWFDTTFPVDMAFWRQLTADNTQIASRMTGTGRLYTNLTNAEGSTSAAQWDYMDGWYDGGINSSYSWMWKRAPNYFDVVAYTGNGTAGRTVSHNLGVAPEMMWIKNRDGARNWAVYHKDLGGTKLLYLNGANAAITESNIFNNTDPTESVFTLGSNRDVNSSISENHIAYLFASLDGVSKVGSYTGNGGSSTINVDCGFTSGARFVLIKETSGTGDWWVFDTARGLVAGNDPALKLNTTDAELSADFIDPYSAGFSLQTNSGINTNGATFIFYAIA